MFLEGVHGHKVVLYMLECTHLQCHAQVTYAYCEKAFNVYIAMRTAHTLQHTSETVLSTF